MNFEHKGIRANIPQEMLNDVGHMGFDITGILKTAINRMLLVAGKDTDDFTVALKVLNPTCEPHKCDFSIQVLRT